jgi:hypothetical protein
LGLSCGCMESASGEPRWPAFTRTPYSYPGSLFTVLEARSRRPFGAWPRRVAVRRRRTLIFGRRTSTERLAAAPRPHRVRRRLARRAMMAASLQRVTGWCAPSGAERCAVSLNGVAEALRPFLSVDKPAFRELSRKVKVLGQQVAGGSAHLAGIEAISGGRLPMPEPDMTLPTSWRLSHPEYDGSCSKGESKQCQDKRHWIAIPWRWL